MNYEPAKLDEETVAKLREFEHRMSEATGEPVVLIAYTDHEQAPTEKKRP